MSLPICGCTPSDQVRLAATPMIRLLATGAGVDRSAVRVRPRMFDNDRFADCTAAAVFNACLALASLQGTGWEPSLIDGLADRFYAACIGATPGTDLATTSGVDLLTVLRRLASVGCDVGLAAPIVCRHGVIANTDHGLMLEAMNSLGFAMLGVTLHQADDQAPSGAVLDGGDDSPIVGGHCLLAWDAPQGLAGTVTLITYGGFWTVTWDWLRRRVFEAHGLVLAPPFGPPADLSGTLEMAALAGSAPLAWEA